MNCVGATFSLIYTTEQHRMMQHDAAGVCALRLGQRTALAETARRAADVQGAEAFVYRNPFRPDGRQKPFAQQAEGRGIVLEAELVVAGLRVGEAGRERAKSGDSLKPRHQELSVVRPLGVAGVELQKLRQENGRLELGERTDDVAAIRPDAGALAHFGISGQQRPAAARREQLGPAETENADVAPGAS